MNGNYNLNTIALSLKKICAVKVAELVMKVCIGDKPVSGDYSIDTHAPQIIRSAELPIDLEEMVENLIPWMMTELKYWHERYCCNNFPIWTSHGTVDVIKSATSILQNKTMHRVDRYKLACEFCLVEHIGEITNDIDSTPLDSREVAMMSNLYYFPMELWSRVFNGEFGELSDVMSLPQIAYNEGFQSALQMYNDAAIRYFIDKASPDVVRRCIYKAAYGDLKMENFLPATICLLYSKLCEYQQQDVIHQCVEGIPRAYIYWTSLHQLIKVIRKFSEHKRGYHNQQMQQMFAKLWQLAPVYRRFQHFDVYILHHEAVYKILETKDDLLINFIFDKMSVELKDELLTKFRNNSICLRLIVLKEFRLLELFLRTCSLPSHRNVLLELKSIFMTLGPVEHRYYFRGHIFNMDDKWNLLYEGLPHFAEIVDQIVSELPSADELN